MAAVEIRRPINSVTQNIRDFAASGNYYCTDEMSRELAAINSGLEHMKLDADITNSSKDWQKKHNPADTYQGNDLTGIFCGHVNISFYLSTCQMIQGILHFRHLTSYYQYY